VAAATVEDAPLLAELGARTFRDAFAADNSAEDMERYLAENFTVEKVRGELADPRAQFLIARDGDGAAVGYAKLLAGEAEPCVTSPAPVELVRLYAVKERHGRGVGAVLMGACLRTAAAMGGKTLWLGVWEHNHRARAFYERWGFRAVGSHVFVLGDDRQTDIIMERPAG
jgi:GNAT superfamily N-acetyltransferase